MVKVELIDAKFDTAENVGDREGHSIGKLDSRCWSHDGLQHQLGCGAACQ